MHHMPHPASAERDQPVIRALEDAHPFVEWRDHGRSLWLRQRIEDRAVLLSPTAASARAAIGQRDLAVGSVIGKDPGRARSTGLPRIERPGPDQACACAGRARLKRTGAGEGDDPRRYSGSLPPRTACSGFDQNHIRTPATADTTLAALPSASTSRRVLP